MQTDGKAHGGTALIIRDCIKQYEIDKHQKDFLRRRKSVEWLH